MPPRWNLAKDKGIQDVDVQTNITPAIEGLNGEINDESQSGSQGSPVPQRRENVAIIAVLDQLALKGYADGMRYNVDNALNDWLHANIQQTFTVIKRLLT